MPDYLVTWDINICADTPEAAAREAHRIQRANGTATIFDVTNEFGETTRIDLDLIDQEPDALLGSVNHMPDQGVEP